MPRVTTAYVSQYQRSRIHQSDFVRGEQTTFHAQFNGALDEGVLIDEVTWFTGTPWAVILSNPQIATDRRSVSVDVTIGYAGPGDLKCVVTLDNGQVRNQLYRITIMDNPFVEGESAPSAGPNSVTATIPDLAVTVEPDPWEELLGGGSGIVDAQVFVATVTGGTPPYVYSWGLSFETQEGVMTLGDQAENQITLFVDTDNDLGSYTAFLDLLVTDANDNEVDASPVPLNAILVGS